jgi:hypothetical protein
MKGNVDILIGFFGCDCQLVIDNIGLVDFDGISIP